MLYGSERCEEIAQYFDKYQIKVKFYSTNKSVVMKARSMIFHHVAHFQKENYHLNTLEWQCTSQLRK